MNKMRNELFPLNFVCWLLQPCRKVQVLTSSKYPIAESALISSIAFNKMLVYSLRKKHVDPPLNIH